MDTNTGKHPGGRPSNAHVAETDRQWEEKFQRLIDPHYYDHDERSPIPCSLSIVGCLAKRSGSGLRRATGAA